MVALVPSVFVSALFGGVAIGLAVAMLLFFNGRVAGVSGIVGGIVVPRPGETSWRVAFAAGLVAGGLAARIVAPRTLGTTDAPLAVLAIAGVLVGFGTRLGAGCTSGHGVCGVSRGSPRSILATIVFMAIAGAVVFISHRTGPS